jgi:hypothetical protein
MRLHSRVILGAAMICGPKTVFAHEGMLQRECELRLKFEQMTEEKLGFVPLFQSERLKAFTKAEGAERFVISAIHPRFGMVLAFLDYTLTDQGRTLEIDKVDVLNANNLRKGLSNLLFAQVMETKPPVEKVVASLADVNVRVLEATGPGCAEAFSQTPLGRTLEHYGFNRVTVLECKPATHEYKFAIARDAAT